MSIADSPANPLISRLRATLIYVAWFQALIGVLGSLFFSEVMGLAACTLCWYQRIALYPLLPILTAGILLADRNVRYYALPLSIIGWLIALYHTLLYYGVIPEVISTCSAGVSCTTRQIEWFGVITIPLLSLAAFTVITLSLIFFKRETPEDDADDESAENQADR
ncbi:MAG: disulfide bond formation protein B [Anaerolineae bacterium]|nr:disulfide bond formation protein B [Anaerolineae bacterium]